ncbi:sulfite exporter TauE/SafE family protein [Fulvivirgaceae bacterium BMA10]|uniref:Probable membrane transporter protein n=1 Tax=Splendidivirga corallicola TaxID=3051826 RepID=A0ABT8KNR5_9BACT|nr:sulfite exporter TauE/SafE family protein [Fulvivirgaceae bacterium BMA10]
MFDILGYILAIVIGFTLGLIGGGGSILTVPVLVYLLGINPILATAYSLFIVGATSTIGALDYMKKGLLSYKTAIVFAVPSFIAVYLTRKILLPAVPQEIASTGDFILTKPIALMLFFAVIMLFSGVSMIRSAKKIGTAPAYISKNFNYPLILIEGAIVGVITGLVGAGGGFLIIPALVLLGKLPMKLAVGTSLFIIAVKSLIGFLGDVGTQDINWRFLLLFTLFSILGIFVGSYTSKLIEGPRLKKGFGWFVLIMAIYIIVKESLLLG